VLTLNSIILLFFLLIEARRYRYYDVWRSRVRLLEVNFILPFLSAELCKPRSGWREELGTDLLVPRFKIGLLEAFGRRFRRNYVWIFLLLIFGWLADLAIALDGGLSFGGFVRRAELGPVPGWLVLAAQGVYLAALAVIAIITMGRRQASGRVYESREALCLFQDDTHF
jgi:uncharacterized membrane protein